MKHGSGIKRDRRLIAFGIASGLIARKSVTTFPKSLLCLSSCQAADARLRKLESLFCTFDAAALEPLLVPELLLHPQARLNKNGVSDPAKNQENRNSDNHAASGADDRPPGRIA